MKRKNMVYKRVLPLITAAMLITALIVYHYIFNLTVHLPSTDYIYIDMDDNTDSVQIKISKAIDSDCSLGFSAMTWLDNYRVKTGRYAIETNDNLIRIYRKLKYGHQTPVRLTIPSVRTMERLAGVIGNKLMLDSAIIAQNLTEQSFCREYGYDTITIACLFIPNTYEVYWNIRLEDFMKRMQRENKAFWTKERLNKAHSIGLTPNEIITLASIVDEETANNGEKPMVAGLYINRLRIGMPLQADPTIKFAMRAFGLRRIYHNLLDVDSPYNTYRNTGLPPGPIRIPSIAGIDAVLNHTKHKFLYMCAKEDFSGTHSFVRTYTEHLRNAAKYSAALNRRGIK